MSRLERTGHPGGGGIAQTPGTFTRPVLVGLTTDLDPVSLDVTDLYNDRDRDGDGRPDHQPWRGATTGWTPVPTPPP